jgi:hypothetical protein
LQFIAKCSHDTYLLAWIAGSHAVSVTSHEDTLHFRPDRPFAKILCRNWGLFFEEEKECAKA